MRFPGLFTMTTSFLERCMSSSTEIADPGAGVYWVPARPLGYPSHRHRLKAAWLVLIGEADAVVWEETMIERRAPHTIRRHFMTLKPCPFCGSTVLNGPIEPELPDFPMTLVECLNCETTGPIATDKPGAIAAWNRAPRPNEIKQHCVSFVYWWWNQPGTNTEQGYDRYIEQMQPLGLPTDTTEE